MQPMTPAINGSAIYHRSAELLQRLIQFDTTNPPGNESECISFINRLLAEAQIETRVFAKSPERPNLIARLSGRGKAPPLLLYGHVDVVTTKDQEWCHPPFEGRLRDGFVWGRGALDMKGGVAMMLAAFLRAKAERLATPGDVILAIVCDEEAGGDVGAKFLVEEHPYQFQGIRYAIGEFGGFPLYFGKRPFYIIQVAEKQLCSVKATVRGLTRHSSFHVRNGAMARLARLLQQLNRHRLPVHITPVARLMFGTMASTLGGANRLIFSQLLNPLLTNAMLKLLGERGRLFDPLLHNTANPTILQGSETDYLIPSQVSVELDGCLLPGLDPEDMIRELRHIVGSDVGLELIRYDPGPPDSDMGLFGQLAGVLRELDPHGVPVPAMMSGVSDARFFSRLGIHTYGFLPMALPEEFDFLQMIHAADERIPVSAIVFGAEAIYRVLQRFGA